MKFIVLLLLPIFGNAQTKTLKYDWRKISGPSQYKIESPHSATTKFSNLVAGVYQFELTVTNSKGLSARDTMMVTVNPPVNRAPSKAAVKKKKSSG